jgi:hypothetical protein
MFSRLVIAGLLLLGLSHSCGAAAVLSFMEYSDVSTERIRISDIAKLKGDLPEASALLNLDLGRAPYPGRVDHVKVANVMAWIRRRLPQLEQLQWEGPAEVALRTKERTISFDELADLTRKTLVARLDLAEKDIALDPMSRRKDFVIPDRPYQLTVTQMELDKRCQRLTTMTQAVANGRFLASLPLQFSLLAEPAQVCEQTRKAMLEQQPQQQPGSGYAIRQLSPIAVELHIGGLTLETSGIALANASVGDLVRVRPAEGPGQYLAKVIAPGRALVAPGGSQ